MRDTIVKVTHLKNYLGREWVHSGINFSVHKGEIFAIIGGSGSGKTTILRSILMLMKPTSGRIQVFNQNIFNLSNDEANDIRKRWGVLFQHGALFSAMTVLENIMFPIKELTHLDFEFIKKLALLKLDLVELPIEAGNKYPAELSGGMQRRAAAARAIAMDPELLFLDEPTSGLDPLSARHFDDLILFLRDNLQLTIVMISHDMESLKKTADKIAFVGDGKILSIDSLENLKNNRHPIIAEYFSNFK